MPARLARNISRVHRIDLHFTSTRVDLWSDVNEADATPRQRVLAVHALRGLESYQLQPRAQDLLGRLGA